jgi:hypothetical protein
MLIRDLLGFLVLATTKIINISVQKPKRVIDKSTPFGILWFCNKFFIQGCDQLIKEFVKGPS